MFRIACIESLWWMSTYELPRVFIRNEHAFFLSFFFIIWVDRFVRICRAGWLLASVCVYVNLIRVWAKCNIQSSRLNFPSILRQMTFCFFNCFFFLSFAFRFDEQITICSLNWIDVTMAQVRFGSVDKQPRQKSLNRQFLSVSVFLFNWIFSLQQISSVSVLCFWFSAEKFVRSDVCWQQAKG